MTSGKHVTKKSPKDPTFSANWSGVSHAPVAVGVKCSVCGKHVHREADSHYCPYCDDFVKVVPR